MLLSVCLTTYAVFTNTRVFAATTNVSMYKLTGEKTVVNRDEIQKYEADGWYIHNVEYTLVFYRVFPNNIVRENKRIIDRYADIEALMVEGWYPYPVCLVYNLDGDELTIKKSELSSYEARGWYYTPSVRVYNADGQKKIIPKTELKKALSEGWYDEPMCYMYKLDADPITVSEANKDKYISLGWYPYPVCIVYSLDGKEHLINKNDLDKYLESNCYEVPSTKLYKPDGSEKVVPNTEVEKALRAGWYDEPMCTLYKLDSKPISIPVSEKSEYIFQGWYSYPICMVYSLDGKELLINKNDLGEYLATNWYEVPSSRVYKPDGSEKIVPNAELETVLKDGWYDEPVFYMYKLGNNPKIVKASEKEAHINNGWGFEETVFIYSTDGREGIVKRPLAEAYKKLGWHTSKKDAEISNEKTQGSEPLNPKVNSENLIKVLVDDKTLVFDVNPVIINGSTMVPLRVIFEELGASVEWNQVTKTAESTKHETTILLPLYGKKMVVNDYVVTLNEAATIINGRILVPVRAISEAFGYEVGWDNKEKVVSILKSQTMCTFMYAEGGRKRVFNITETCSQYENGWYLDEDLTINKKHPDVTTTGVCDICRKKLDYVTMYSSDGKEINVREDKVDEQKAEGWYEEPVILMLSPDGELQYIEVSKSDDYRNLGWLSSITMYNLDGKTISVSPDKIDEHKNVGWLLEKPILMYTIDGRTKYVEKSKVDDYKKVGWYDNIADVQMTVYAEGKSKVIFIHELDAYKKVGWFEPITVYAEDGRTLKINPFKVDEYKKVGWHTSVTLYSEDGRTIKVNPFKVDEYKKVGWFTEPPVNVQQNPSNKPVLDAEQIYTKCSPAVFYIEVFNKYGSKLSTGSGFFVNDTGLAVTNYHVIEDSYSQKIQLANSNKKYNVKKIVKYNSTQDWAIIQVDISGNSYLSIGDASTVVGGAKIFAIGSPLGLQNTISEGIISNPKRRDDGIDYIQITAAISNGSSGGALINKHGEAIGITAAYYVNGQNLNLAIPLTYLKDYL